MNFSFYVITSEALDFKRSHLDVVEAAIEGGATVIQFREKNKNTVELFKIARELHRRTRAANVPLIINDRLDIAQAVGAEGVHLGKEDMPVKVARRILGRSAIIGASCGNVKDALKAESDGADYIGVGPIFPTITKKNARKPIGIDGLIDIKNYVDIPVVAIGGISSDNIQSVMEAGADGVAIISAVAVAPDMKEESHVLFEKIKRSRRSNCESK
ncbi:MAG TPA: thiamine phosphate synthase [Actinobacteria bacterium]|nr:thiamine phosphate synthase [Actinomycetota bacterium]